MAKQSNEESTVEAEDLFRAILSLQDMSEAKRFLRDLLTEAEIADLSLRWKAARMLDQGIAYSQIEKETGLSSATVARISKWLKSGKGGYQLMLDRLRTSEKMSHQ